MTNWARGSDVEIGQEDQFRQDLPAGGLLGGVALPGQICAAGVEGCQATQLSGQDFGVIGACTNALSETFTINAQLLSLAAQVSACACMGALPRFRGASSQTPTNVRRTTDYISILHG